MDRLEINRISDTNIQITIGFKKDAVSTSQLVFLVIGIIGLSVFIRQIFVDDRVFTKVFLIIWCCVWVFFLIKIWNLVKWRRFSNEIINVTKNELNITEKLPFNVKKQSFKLSDICITLNTYSIPSSKSLFEVHPGNINIENQNHFILKSFGKYLTKEEIVIIIGELQLFGIATNDKVNFSEEKVSNIELDKFSKKNIGKIRKQLFIICLLPVSIYSYFHFKNQNEMENEKYYRLKGTGIITTANSEFQKHWDTDYYYYYFVTENGQKVEKTGKCGNLDTFNKDYKDLKVIYNPSIPTEFMEYPDFLMYSTNYPFLWLIISTLFFALFASTIILMGYLGFNGYFRMMINR